MTLKEEAKVFATEAHTGQTRKSTGTPMIAHPIRVALQLERAGFSAELVAAGFLHDVVEDTPISMKEIEERFGKLVAYYVAGNTEDKTKTWEERKQHTIDEIVHAPLEIKALVVADKLDNLTCLIEDYESFGEELWSHFKRGYDKQKWYFASVAENCTAGLNEEEIPAFFKEYQEKVKAFFAN